MKSLFFTIVFFLTPAGFRVKAEMAASANNDMLLWYRQPAHKWLEAMPIGNGYMGGMVFGGVQQERIALNESSFWSGSPHDYNDTNAINYFPKVRDLVFAEKFSEAEKLADDHFWGIPRRQQMYEPVGDLVLKFIGADNVQDYRRELNLETGVARTTYRVGDALFTRDVFMSYPDHVLVVHISSDKQGRISLEAGLKSPFLDTVIAKPGKLVADGSWKRPFWFTNSLMPVLDGPGLKLETAMLAQADGGSCDATTNSLCFLKANAVTLVLTIATSYVNYTNISADPATRCEKVLSRVAGRDYTTLLQRHEKDFQGLMDRVHLAVGDPAMNEHPTDERLAAVHAGTPDPNLEALVFQFGRYILASSSRAGGQPANLQGIWNEDVLPPWGSKYTININTEMNYWPAEVCNLSECAQPLFDLIHDVSVNGRETAKDYYDCGGWVAHHNIDLWRGTAPVDTIHSGLWPVGGAWLCQSLWEHYAFTCDTNFLREYYPVMKGAAEFLLEFMVEDPKHHWLVTPFSMSPEHGFYDSNGNMCVLSPSPTMDVGIIRELFPHCIEASKILGVDADFRAKLEAALTKIPPYRIGKSGFVQEWIEDWKPGPQGHNVSPNFPFYPGSSITLRGNPEFAAAYQRWMEAHQPRGGFPLSWGIAMWARLERGDKVGSLIEEYLNRSTAANLHNRGSNQSDASFGYSAAVAEALLQSHAGEISLLPALPTQWPNGSVTGLRARGGYVVNMEWKNGKLTSAKITSANSGKFQIRNGKKVASLKIKAGQILHLNAELAVLN
jgi:alpha-L-fucosidase 2